MTSVTRYTIILFLAMILICTSVLAEDAGTQSGYSVGNELSALPLSFIPNVGQVDPQVLYFVKASDYSLYFLDDEVVLFSYDTGSVVRMSVAGAGPSLVEGIEPLGGKANFFTGGDPADWKTGVTTYGGILYTDVVPGADLYFRGKDGILKREFVLSEGADPSAIRMKYEGVDSISVTADGSLLVQTTGGALTEDAPVCYQVIDGQQKPVSCRYVIFGDEVGFSLGLYDTAYPVVIDPVLDFADFLGGDNRDYGFGIVADAEGNFVVTGATSSPDFPIADSAINATLNGNKDVFVTKFPADGSTLLWSTYLGGNRSEESLAIAMDPFYDNTTIITGYTNSNNFPVMGGLSKPDMNETSSSDVFAAGLDTNGNLVFSTMWGGGDTDVGTGVAVDPSGNGWTYVTGFTYSPDFNITPGAFLGTKMGVPPARYADAFLTGFQWSSDPATLTYSTFIGGNLTDKGQGVALNNTTQNIYVTGYTESPNFLRANAKFPAAIQGGRDIFVVKFTGLAVPVINWSENLGGSADDVGNGIAIDSLDRAVVTGYTISPDYKTSLNAYHKTAYGIPPFSDVFISRFKPDGSLNYSTYLGGVNSDAGKAVALDNLNNIYITGYTTSLDFPSVNSAHIQPAKNAFQDAFVTMMNENGKTLNFSTFLGGGLDDTGTAIAVNSPFDIWVTGYTTSFDLIRNLKLSHRIPTGSTYEWYNTYFGDHYGNFEDAFIAKINNRPEPAFPDADFNGTPRSGSAPLTVQFNDLSTGNPTMWDWDFGDGQPNSTDKNPIHTYDNPGNYTVTLTASNSVGTDTERKVDYIIVGKPSSLSFVPSCENTTRLSRILIPVNGTRQVSFMLDQAPNGLSAYNYTLRMNDTWVANFTDLRRPCWMPEADDYPGFIPNEGNPGWPFPLEGIGNHSPVNLTFAGIDLPAPPEDPDPLGVIQAGAEDISQANLTIKGLHNGTANITVVAVDELNDDDDLPITLHPPYTSVLLEIQVVDLFPIPPGNPHPPQDLDGDGLYEDINGDGRATFKDVEVFFVNFWFVKNNEPLDFFDFDRNGRYSYHDVTALFMIIAMSTS
ncbi:MAG: PKD domain-containing protein [Methanoregulaceae archaeon]|nr:PKD domain-containing protein [Methanoregulaceae archaeon]